MWAGPSFNLDPDHFELMTHQLTLSNVKKNVKNVKNRQVGDRSMARLMQPPNPASLVAQPHNPASVSSLSSQRDRRSLGPQPRWYTSLKIQPRIPASYHSVTAVAVHKWRDGERCKK